MMLINNRQIIVKNTNMHRLVSFVLCKAVTNPSPKLVLSFPCNTVGNFGSNLRIHQRFYTTSEPGYTHFGHKRRKFGRKEFVLLASISVLLVAFVLEDFRRKKL